MISDFNTHNSAFDIIHAPNMKYVYNSSNTGKRIRIKYQGGTKYCIIVSLQELLHSFSAGTYFGENYEEVCANSSKVVIYNS